MDFILKKMADINMAKTFSHTNVLKADGSLVLYAFEKYASNDLSLLQKELAIVSFEDEGHSFLFQIQRFDTDNDFFIKIITTKRFEFPEVIIKPDDDNPVICDTTDCYFEREHSFIELKVGIATINKIRKSTAIGLQVVEKINENKMTPNSINFLTYRQKTAILKLLPSALYTEDFLKQMDA